MIEPRAAPSGDCWAAIEPLFDRALDLPSEHRPAFLAETCGTDPVLRREVERLLEASGDQDDFLHEPAPIFASPVVAWVARHQEPAPGAWLGPYLIESELARGGMATVYLAHDPKHQRRVALKVIRPELSGAVGAARFAREIAIVAGLSHPNVLPLYDSGALKAGDGPPLLFYTMPYVSGRSLRERLREEPQLPLSEAIGIARQVGAALDHAHRHGVIHRDIKPENILLADPPRGTDGAPGECACVVADFGIARALNPAAGDQITEPNVTLGTPGYMSPERGLGASDADGRGDLYALGCVLYEMLAGQPPFPGPTSQAILARHAADPVPPLRTVRPGVPAAVEAAIGRALAKRPADRPGTAWEFLRELDGSAAPRMRVPSARRIWVGALAVVAAIAVVAVTRRAPARSRADPATIAVLPFRTSGESGAQLAWLREGMVDLLTVKLGEGGLRVAEPRAVLSAWRAVAGPEVGDVGLASALEVGRRVGAERVIDGSVVGTLRHLTLTAAVLTGPAERVTAGASVEGPLDSLPALVDQLAARLLSLDAGTDSTRVSSSTSRSLPAVRAYLAGRAAFRKGQFPEALNNYQEATLLDSSFALAALELLRVSRWVAPEGPEARRARRLARAGRARLTPPDRALLDVWADAYRTMPELIRPWRVAATTYPDRAEFWYGLGDVYYHYGGLVGLEQPLTLADDAFRRGWALDSARGAEDGAARSPAFAEPLGHMVELAALRGDGASVLRLSALGLAADSTTAEGWYLRWHRAVVQGDAARRAFWADSDRADPGVFRLIHRFVASTGMATGDYVRSGDLMLKRLALQDPDAADLSRQFIELTAGRPREAGGRIAGMLESADVKEGLAVDEALYWGADTSLVPDAIRRLTPSAVGRARRGREGMAHVHGLCTLAAWRASRSDYRFVGATVQVLRRSVIAGLDPLDSIATVHYTAKCAALLEAQRATALRLPTARAALEAADAAARSYEAGPSLGANLVVARLAEAQGDLPLALRAVRRRAMAYGMEPAWYLSSFLREEGRLAALSGDTAEAARAYRHYLALRPDPEPEVRLEVDLVRRELTALGAALP